MTLKRIGADASIRIGSLWIPVKHLPQALARFTKLVFCLTGSDVTIPIRCGEAPPA
jgi:hypothetical protein